MIRLTQPELVHDKKQQDSSTPDDGTTALKKEANVVPVTSQGTDQASSGTLVAFISPVFVEIYLVSSIVGYHKHLTEILSTLV